MIIFKQKIAIKKNKTIREIEKIIYKEDTKNNKIKELSKIVNEKKKKLWDAAEERLYSLYGDEPDFFLINRFKTEKNFLQDTDAIVLFAAIARVRRIAVEHGTLINVRGLLNGSFTAWLIGATAFNPLPAHTYCPRCKRIRFHREVQDGLDLQKELCICAHWLNRDGHNLPFETYLDKVKTNFCSIDCVVSSSIVSEVKIRIPSF